MVWIVRLRWAFFALVALMLAAGLNGQWRVGRDSALYRGVAEDLANHGTYTFRGERERQIYPGLPLLLAGIEKIHPSSKLQPVVPLLVMLALAGLTLVVVYRLMSAYFPPWVAVCVTTGVGINLEFLSQAHELMTDVPFLLGTCLALAGFERLRRAPDGRRIAWALLTTFGGLLLAILMRPTAMAVAAAWCAACAWGLLRGPNRGRYALAMGLLLVLGAVFWLSLDPRGSSPSRRAAAMAAASDDAPWAQRMLHKLVRGKYESDAFHRIETLTPKRLADDLLTIGEDHFPEAFFSISLGPGISSVYTVMIIAAGIALMWRFPLWGMLVLISTVMTVLFGSTPRYYLMILPLLLLGWALLLQAIASRAWFRPYGAILIMGSGLGAVVVPNLVKDTAFILEQHGVSFRTFKHDGFMQVYRDGKMAPIIRMSQKLAECTRLGDAHILGPEPRIMSYLSGRRVYDVAEFARRLKGQLARSYDPKTKQWKFVDARFAALKYAVLPPDLYDRGSASAFLTRAVTAGKTAVCAADDFRVSEISPKAPKVGTATAKGHHAATRHGTGAVRLRQRPVATQPTSASRP